MDVVTCRRCHKILTNPKSIERGYGPVCWVKMGFKAELKKSLYILTQLYDGDKLTTLEEFFGESANTTEE